MTDRPCVIGAGPLTVVVNPARGGRVLSLTCDGREWLAVSDPADLARVPDADDPFVRPGMGGWDEVIPTVAATTLPDGTELTDHGEAWRRAWTVDKMSAGESTLSLRLDTLPLVLRRIVAVRGRRLTLTYEVEVDPDANGPVPLLWSAHPQFAAPVGARLVLGRGPATLSVQHPPNTGDLIFDDDDVMARLAPGAAVKAFLSPAEPVDRASIVHSDGAALTMRWDTAVVPYLGLWWDNGFCAGEPVMAIEPCTGWGDDTAAAVATGRIMRIPPGGSRSWQIGVSVSPRRC